jgi:hypothetical protein
MSEIETEILKVSKLRKRADEYDNRQDYLAAVLRSFDKVAAKDESVANTIGDDAYSWYEEAATAMNAKRTIPDFPDLELEDPGPDEIEEEELSEFEDDEAVVDATEDSGEAEDDDNEAEKPAKAAAPPVKAKPKKEKTKTQYDDLTGEKDRFGVIVGTKASQALKMFERGATMKEIKNEVGGGTQYNLLTRMTKEGHLVEKQAGGVWKLTHKDNVK